MGTDASEPAPTTLSRPDRRRKQSIGGRRGSLDAPPSASWQYRFPSWQYQLIACGGQSAAPLADTRQCKPIWTDIGTTTSTRPSTATAHVSDNSPRAAVLPVHVLPHLCGQTLARQMLQLTVQMEAPAAARAQVAVAYPAHPAYPAHTAHPAHPVPQPVAAAIYHCREASCACRGSGPLVGTAGYQQPQRAS